MSTDYTAMALPTDQPAGTSSPTPNSTAPPIKAGATVGAGQAAPDNPMRGMWLSHHWPEDQAQRCVTVGGRPVCRRCLALYPLGVLVAVLAAFGLAPWPTTWDPAAIWVLSIPATVAFVGEMLGWFGYSSRWQVATTLLAALAYGRALGYEFNERWSPEFWEPITVFGGLWFFAALHRFQSDQIRANR